MENQSNSSQQPEKWKIVLFNILIASLDRFKECCCRRRLLLHMHCIALHVGTLALTL